LADCDRSISLNSNYGQVYKFRGLLKINEFNDRDGGIADLRSAVKIFREQGQTQALKDTLQLLQQLGITE
jgi:hypothetical protein